ncbi:hypothetical protein SAMN05216188_13073 [Lentzea xinjiangensis]|uniref:Uncharacterized protein n=1 Tax=Lentzea xinjiangensis TaxID=402600 RepID=A0A1H9W490_9PSEU|nr:hypothetical protein [Lentzea xinjiangensis]SES28770.1 hypothetical protein SAMN05216188_13073 [Lentzea xinjiangensis]
MTPPQPEAVRYTTSRAGHRGSDELVPGLLLAISFTNGPDGAQTEVRLETEEITAWSEFHDERGTLVLDFDLRSVATAACRNTGFYLWGQARFDRTMHTFSGTLSALCNDREGTIPYRWEGEVAQENRNIAQQLALLLTAAVTGSST